MGDIKVAIAGVGNCCSSLIQGIEYYKNGNKEGLLHKKIGPFEVSDLKFVAAFDIDSKKVGKDLSKAIFAAPNKAPKFKDVGMLGVKVDMGLAPDVMEEKTMSEIKLSNKKPVDVSKILSNTKTDILVNLISGGSDKASRLYAEAALKTGCAYLNATPAGIVNDLSIINAFKKKGLPLAGDDLLSQMGATVLHMGLLEFLNGRGVKIEESYQLDVGGGSESINTLEKTRETKRKIKTDAVKNSLPYEFSLVSGSADFVDFLINGRDSFFYIRGKYFSEAPFSLDVKLSTVDGPNSGAVLLDTIRALKIALNKGIGGPVDEICSYGFKRPPKRHKIANSYKLFQEFIEE